MIYEAPHIQASLPPTHSFRLKACCLWQFSYRNGSAESLLWGLYGSQSWKSFTVSSLKQFADPCSSCILASLQFQERVLHSPTSGTLHLLFPLSGVFFPQIPAWFTPQLILGFGQKASSQRGPSLPELPSHFSCCVFLHITYRHLTYYTFYLFWLSSVFPCLM